VSPHRRNPHESHVGQEPAFVLRIGHGEVQVGRRRQVEDGNVNRAKRRLDVAVEALRAADVVILPGSRELDGSIR
jgi:hypothetical protein